MKISVIIPCFNVEKYIDECLKSIEEQSIGIDNLEVILVDDCSTDGTLDVLRKFEQRYPDNCILIPCEKNGHQGTARNIGLQYASGDYVSFVDGDDCIHKDTYLILSEVCGATKADIVQFRFGYSLDEIDYARSRVNEDYKVQLYEYDEIAKRKAFFNDYGILNGSCTTKFYSRNILLKSGARFAEGVCYEEPLFTIPLKLYVDRVAVLEKKLYYYRSNPGGTTLQTMQNSSAIGGHIETQYQLYKRLISDKLYGDLKEEIDLYFIHSFYCEPFYFLHQRKMYMSLELYRLICNLIKKVLPDYKDAAKRLTDQDAELFEYFDIEDMNDEMIASFTNSILGMELKIEDYDGIVSSWIEGREEALKIYDIGMPAEDSSIYKEHTYALLHGLFHLRELTVDGEDIYKEFYNSVQRAALYNAREKVKKKEKVRVAFLPISAAQWPAEDLYRKFESDERFDVMIVPMPLMDRDAEARNRTYKENCLYFDTEKYNFYQIYDENNEEIKGWDYLGGTPDIVIHVTSWDNAYPDVYRTDKYPLNVIQIYVPYGMYLADNKDGSYALDVIYNKDVMNICTRVYMDSLVNLQEFRKYQLLEGKNIVFSGYSKMDYFYKKHNYVPENISQLWSGRLEEVNCKRVIIAPHYSVGVQEDSGLIAYATFDKNYAFWPELIKEYEGKVTFLFKPHPNLAKNCVLSGLFDSYESYDRYIDELESMPNCHVVCEGSYLEYFDTSDAMIMDSGSFIGEYIYANRPLLYLTKSGQYFNKLGNEAMNIHYKCKGEDFDGIRDFIEEVVLKENDINKESRKKFFEENLDYLSINGCLAGEMIYKDVLHMLGIVG